MPRGSWCLHVTSVLIVGLFLLAVPALASAEELKVEVTTIYASNDAALQAPQIDEPLAALSEELVGGFEGYNRFALVARHSLAVTMGKTQELELPDKGKSTLEVGFVGRTTDEKPPLLRLSVGLAGKIAAEVKASPGSTFFQAGLLYKDGILVLAIAAHEL